MSLTITVFGFYDTTTGRLGIHRAHLDRGVRRTLDRPWSKIAKAIHGHGIPTVTLDPISTPHAIACQLVLKGYWHGYIGSDEPALANAVAMAYPGRSSAFGVRLCSEQCLCSRDAARTTDPPRIRPGSRRGEDPPVRAP